MDCYVNFLKPSRRLNFLVPARRRLLTKDYQMRIINLLVASAWVCGAVCQCGRVALSDAGGDAAIVPAACGSMVCTAEAPVCVNVQYEGVPDGSNGQAPYQCYGLGACADE